ncbi:mannose-1-phosphate guanylyltransferase [Sandaracinus amylolyticus]|uniref:mannose-1-phosphate guanylyltransferase n=1 Tax=Sandaracinus amylolyticus TaxID=927083 RepID=UPI001F19DC8B|nr:mannose-1-phosphate guanylyltransferase [Sandaracinus amylolyticus]UJR80693.1 Alginate biosynthesis protein AlgA [Sandaracinus amylolyticus]
MTTKQHAWAVIMAGGSGTRFWPLSRKAHPKQLLPLAGSDASLLAETVRRIAPIIPAERVVVVTAEHLADATRAALPNVPAENVLAEPVGRNTAPCVGWAAAHVRRRDADGIVAVLAADHHIGDEPGFLTILERALGAAEHGELVTLGIKPTRPETGYGYLEVGEELGPGVYRARRFVEKPNRARAEQFLTSGSFLWNSGMFFFRASSVLDAIRVHLPGLGAALERFDHAAEQGREQDVVRAEYAALPSISIDHGVMEKEDRVVVVPGDFGWSDVGSWLTAWELAAKDAQNNAVAAGGASDDVVLVDATGSYVRAPQGKVVALIGVRDLVVVDTEDALLVVPRDRAQDVRAVVDALKARKRDDKL